MKSIFSNINSSNLARRTFLIATAGIAFAGCATIFSKTTQTVTINSNIQGAEVRIDGNVVGTTPYSGVVKKGSNAKTVLISKEGYQPQQIALNTAINPLLILSIVFWDLGTTDLISGAAWEYSPNSYYVNLIKAGKVSAVTDEIRIKEYAMVKRARLSDPNSEESKNLHAKFFSNKMDLKSFTAKLSELNRLSRSTVEFGESVWKFRDQLGS